MLSLVQINGPKQNTVGTSIPICRIATTQSHLKQCGLEAQYHERFMESRLRVYVERARIQRRLLKHALDTRPCIVLVTGPAGSGKSALMARLVQALEPFGGAAAPPDGSALRLVIPHFVGASPRSTNLRQMLRRFCLILRTRVRIGGETCPAQPPADASPSKLPEQTDQLIEEFQRIVQSILPEDRVVVVIDALNQLDATDNAHAMHWLPRNLPANFRVIVSCIDDSMGAQSMPGSYTSAPAPGAPQVLAAFRHRPHHRVEVTPLSK